MTKLSMSTTRVKFGDVAINSTTVSKDPEAEGFDRYIIGKHIPENADRIETWGPVGDSDFGPRIRTIFQPGDVICTTRGPKLKVARVDFKGLGAHTNFYLRTADPEVLLQPYLEAVVRSNGFQQHLVNNFRGSVNLFVNWSDAAKYEFALPPLEEQRRIVEVLQCISEAAQKHEATMATLSNLEQSIFEHSLEHDQNVKHGSFENFCEFITDGDHNPPKRIATGVPYLVVASIGNGKVDASHCTFISSEDYERVSKRYAPRGGDLLLSCVGSVGDVAVVPDGFVFAADRSLAVYRPKTEQLLPEYAAILLRSRKSQQYFASIATGTAQLHLYLTELRRHKIAVPSLNAQRALVERTADIENQIGRLVTRTTGLQAMYNTILREQLGGAD
jgi:type I restriction enzyme, S subunit